MAGFAGGWEGSCHVVLCRRSLEVRHVAAGARRRRRSVVVVQVALCALQGRVSAGQRVMRVQSMIKLPAQPVGGGVAGVASVRKVQLHVAGVIRAVKVRGVARIAILRHRRVVAVCVALRALNRRMSSRQREDRCVVEIRRRPPGRRVAKRAVGGEAASYVVRVSRAGKVSLVAGVTIGRRRSVVIVRMALGALYRCMLSDERPVSVQGVIEGGVVPIHRAVAGSAVARKIQLHVRRVGAVVEVRRMAAVALGRRTRELVIEMAGRALQSRVRAGQRVTRELQMVKLRTHEVIDRVAGITGGGEVQRDVIDNRRQKVLLVARVTGSGQTHKLPGRRILVALIALHKSVRAYQGETVLVILNLADVRLPALDCMAALAIRSELSTVNVCVALRALGTYLLEDHAGMALRAANLRMHPSQRITCRVVIEFGILPYGLPAHAGVAVLTGNRHRAVGIGHLRLRSTRLRVRRICRHMNRQAAHCGGQPECY